MDNLVSEYQIDDKLLKFYNLGPIGLFRFVTAITKFSRVLWLKYISQFET